MNVLIAVDPSEESREAAEMAYRFFGPDNEYTLLSVGNRGPILCGTWPIGSHHNAGELMRLLDNAAADDALQVANEVNTVLTPAATLTIGLAEPGRVICERASEADADVIVIGSQDKSFWERLIDPSIGRYLVDNAPCPVLVIR